jgi:hypothetical protein
MGLSLDPGDMLLMTAFTSRGSGASGDRLGSRDAASESGRLPLAVMGPEGSALRVDAFSRWCPVRPPAFPPSLMAIRGSGSAGSR